MQNQPIQTRDALSVNHDVTIGLLAGLRAFLATQEAMDGVGLAMPPPAPLGPRNGSKIETTESVESPETSPQLELEV
jgi:hypothetical protein